jgi:cytochrome d ubiquinol oxidase subunit I
MKKKLKIQAKQIEAISIVTFQELLREKVLWTSFMFSILCVGLAFAVSQLSFSEHARISLDFGLASVAFVGGVISVFMGSTLIAKHEPTKLAALELHYETGSNAPLLIGGVAGENQTIQGPHFKIPGALSWLAGNSASTVVEGINQTPEKERPPLYIHTLFDIKMTLITFLSVAFPAYFLMRWKRPMWLHQSWSLFAMAIMGWFGILLVELGWMMTEIGRQPWAVRGHLTTAQAMTTHDVSFISIIFPVAYALLFAMTLLALRKIVRDNRRAGAKGAK